MSGPQGPPRRAREVAFLFPGSLPGWHALYGSSEVWGCGIISHEKATRCQVPKGPGYTGAKRRFPIRKNSNREPNETARHRRYEGEETHCEHGTRETQHETCRWDARQAHSLSLAGVDCTGQVLCWPSMPCGQKQSKG